MITTKFVVVAIIATAIAIHAQPIRPRISETFEGEGYTHIVTSNETIWGLGRWVIDQPKGLGLDFWEFHHEHRHHSVHLLRRFDLGFEYAINWHHQPTPHQTCRKIAVKPPMHPVWAWLHEAHYHGKHVIDGTTFDLWRHHVGGVELEVAVSEHDASRPHYFTRRTPSEHRVYHFIAWSTFQPNATWFNVPDICKTASFDADDTDDTDIVPAGSAAPHSAQCAILASSAARIVSDSNGFDAASMISAAMTKAEINIDTSSLTSIREAGTACEEGPRTGDVFFDDNYGAAVLLDVNAFAICAPHMGGRCGIIPQYDFNQGCRRYC
jgi:hypothetical protein